MNELQQYCERANETLQVLGEQFYQEPKEETWELYSLFIEGLAFVLGQLERADRSDLVSKLIEAIKELEGAQLSKDFTLIGDIIMYEIRPVYTELTKSR